MQCAGRETFKCNSLTSYTFMVLVEHKNTRMSNAGGQVQHGCAWACAHCLCICTKLHRLLRQFEHLHTTIHCIYIDGAGARLP